MQQRYDDVAEWYDTYVTAGAAAGIHDMADRLLNQLLGPGQGICLDLGCGGGAHAPALSALGWSVIGVDISPAQINVAHRRGETAMIAKADRLPLADNSIDTVATVLTTTDFDDLAAVFAEAHRVLRPGCQLVVVASHPCFGGVFIYRSEDGSCTVHPGYRSHHRFEQHPLLGNGIRSRVGVINVPLPVLVNALTNSGLILQQISEDDGNDPVPKLLALAASKPATAHDSPL
jgi:ubiquinone/menaquinone biosynthesis C-methylase UbiE